MRGSESTGTRYTLRLFNNSNKDWDFCVYQNDPNIDNPEVMSTAWFVQPLAQSSRSTISWNLDWDFIWDQTGELQPGITFDASQVWPADPAAVNVWSTPQSAGDQVTFAYDPIKKEYTFGSGDGQSHQPQNGTLYIYQQGSVPSNQSSVGLAMSGNPVYAMQAQPNIVAEFTPHPVYFITAGSFETGEVLDVTSISRPAGIQYPPGIYSMTATLDTSNNWTIAPTSQLATRRQLQTSSR
jgi:hypothetical protein